jgi:hypothetical protein
MTMKSPRDSSFSHETFKLPRDAARKLAKRLFRQFPPASYMTEIESWRESQGTVEFGLRRLNLPISGEFRLVSSL